MRCIILSIIFALLASPVYAGEISVLGGYGVTNNPTQKAGTYQVEYLEGLGEHFAWSFSYLNRGTLSSTIVTPTPSISGSAPILSTGSYPWPSARAVSYITTP